ncbi:MAG: hypothetical protein AAB638_01500, partial [Patescibacteria group bacterium]
MQWLQEQFITVLFQRLFSLISGLTAVLINVLNFSINVRAGGTIPIVSETWHILRDFSNMFFVIILVYMAFATIFNWTNFTFQKLIVRLIMVAVLINFSLAIGNLVIDACQVLTNVFLASIGNIGDRLGEFLNPSLLLTNKVGVVDAPVAGMVSGAFALILSSIFMFSVLVAAAFSLIRVPLIWALLIVSPLAWMSHILPGSDGWWKKWWSNFIGWNLFLPVYLFFMYLGLLFLSKRNEIMSAVIQTNSSGADPANASVLFGLTNTLTFNLIFFYIFTAFIMIGGTAFAVSTTKMMSGSGMFEKGVGWAKGWVRRAPLPYVGNLEAAEAGAKSRFGQFQKEGFQNSVLNKVYGGKDAQTRADIKGQRFFGVKGATQPEKEFVDAAKKSFDKAQSDYNSGRL